MTTRQKEVLLEFHKFVLKITFSFLFMGGGGYVMLVICENWVEYYFVLERVICFMYSRHPTELYEKP